MRGMKSPRFSLRLLLLVVMLCAAIFAWRRAVWDIDCAERDGEIMRLEYELGRAEWYLRYLLDKGGPGTTIKDYPNLQPEQDVINKLRDEIERLRGR